jgi:hypothetical protein
MPVLNETPVNDDHQELQCLDGPSSIANDNAEGTARAFEIPKPSEANRKQWPKPRARSTERLPQKGSGLSLPNAAIDRRGCRDIGPCKGLGASRDRMCLAVDADHSQAQGVAIAPS